MRALALIALILVAGYAGFELLYADAIVRYRLTLTLEVDGRTHEGSGVLQVTYAERSRILGANSSLTIKVEGEAVAIDLGSRGVLFALLHEGNGPRSGPEWVVPNAFGVTKGGLGSEAFPTIEALKGSIDLAPQYLPLMVRFRDAGDPKTVERVDPGDLATTLGAGVRLTRATLQITRDPITRGIQQRLPWIEQIRGGYITGAETARGVPLGLHGGHFRQGT